MDIFSRKCSFKGIEAAELGFGRYYAVVAYSLGSNVLRFRDNENDIEVFRYSDDMTVAEFMNAPEIWGLPTLYLPNRFDNGVLRTSDEVYQLPVNEKRFGNHLHGFIQKRAHKLKEMGSDSEKAYVVTEYVYDENDFFYNCFPVSFKVEITVTISAKGLEHKVTLTNLSDKMLPVSLATHTTYNAPFVNGGDQENIRLKVPAASKLQFNKRRWLPNGRNLKLNTYDKEYVNDGKRPVLSDICNDMYVGASIDHNGTPFRGTIMTDTATGKSILNEVDENYKFWIVWNDKGFKNYFCAEPMTAQVNAPNLDMPAEKSGYTEIGAGGTYSAWQRFFTEA